MAAPQSESVNARKYRWHQSTLSSLLDGCSWQYFLTYVLELDQGPKPYAAIGTAFHAAVELHEKNRMIDVATTKEEMLAEAVSSLESNILDESMREDLMKPLRAAINNWWGYQREWILKYEPLAIEPEFTLPLVEDAKPIGGYIDAIYTDPVTGNIFIVDHKTAKTFDRWRDGEGHRHQATMYAAALVLDDNFPMITEMPEMVYMVTRTSESNRKDFEHARIVSVQPTIEDVQLLGERIRRAEYVVANEEYAPKTDWPLCSKQWCPFYEGCQETGVLLGTPALVRARVLQQSEPAQSPMSVEVNTEEVTND